MGRRWGAIGIIFTYWGKFKYHYRLPCDVTGDRAPVLDPRNNISRARHIELPCRIDKFNRDGANPRNFMTAQLCNGVKFH